MSEKVALDKPNRQSIERLFRELNDEWRRPYPRHLQKLRDERDALREKLLANPRYIRLCKQLEESEDRHDSTKKKRREKIAKVRREYLARRLTPEVKAAIEKLVDELNSEGAE